MSLKRVLVLAAVTAAIGSPLRAQSYFGKNQVQFDHFDWKVLETEHFYVHYYPVERMAAQDAARMAERAYGRLSRLLGHDFREKKPIVLFASRSDFGQNNVTGDLGEGVGGVTEALRHRILMPFTGDYGSFEQVLTHEMVHEFQYDIYARGKAGGGLQALTQNPLPLWFAEGMAQYLSIGPYHPSTSTVIRDAALNGNLPTLEQMTERPDRYNPYTFGNALFAYIGERWGDEVIGAILSAAPNIGIERAFKREIGLTMEELGDEWREATQVQHLPQIAQLQRARRFSRPLLTERRTGGQIFLAPALSEDGRHIAFLSNGSFLRGEVFIDLWLGDATSGKRIKRLVKSTTNPEFEELRLLYSQSSFSPDGKWLAFTAQRKGKDVLYLLDVARRKVRSRVNLPLEGVTGPSWSPDGKLLVFSGHHGGITDLYIVDADGSNLRQLTNDRHGDLQPKWSPDGKTIAFASDRGPETDFALLRFGRWRITLYHLEEGRLEVLPNQDGLNINPVWAPDGKSLAYVSNRTGIPNLFLYDFTDREHYQLTNVVGGVTALTEYSPAVTWARDADKLAFTYFEDGDYTIWLVDNPRLLKKTPFRQDPPKPVIAKRGVMADSGAVDRARTMGAYGAFAPEPSQSVADASPSDSVATSSFYRSPSGIRPSADLPAAEERTRSGGGLSVAALLDSAAMALPDTGGFKRYSYKVRFSPDYIARPTIGYTRDNFGRGVFGGTAIILSDMLGNNRLAFAGEINGRLSEARAFAAYTNLGRRLQYTTGVYQEPFFFAQDYAFREIPERGTVREEFLITRYIQRQAFAVGIYPLNRFTRSELGLRLTNLDRTNLFLFREIHVPSGARSAWEDSIGTSRSITFVQPYAAYVSDNILTGFTGPIMGRRYRFQVEPTIGSFRFTELLADYRRYDPIIFNFLTVASRLLVSASVGRDADSLRKYIGYPEIIRGYERRSFRRSGDSCALRPTAEFYKCSPLLGSRVAIANLELRFPLLRGGAVGALPLPLPPVEGLIFYDAGFAWFGGQDLSLDRNQPENYDPGAERHLLTSYGFGIRVNLFNFALLRWDYAIPQDRPDRDGFWMFSLGPSF